VETKRKAKSKRQKKTTQALPANFSAYDWGTDLSERQRLFVFYFTWPGQEGFHCASRAARRAGYTDKTANVYSCKMLRNPKIQTLIQKYESQAKASVHNAAQRFIQEKITRADYNVRDFFDVREGVSEKTGKDWRVFLPKTPSELTEEQLLCVDNVVTGQGATNIVFADRQKERDSVIALDRIWNGATNEGGYDVEETKEIIIERVTIRQERRARMAQAADFDIIDKPAADTEEEI
jgi:hypothetical protein